MKKRKHLRKEIKILLSVVLIIVSYIYVSKNGGIATTSKVGEIKIVLGWLSILLGLTNLAIIEK